MSRPDLLTELRTARPTAPAEVRERVALLAATAPAEPPQRRRWVLAAAVAFAILLAATAAIVATRSGGGEQNAQPAAADAPPGPGPATGEALPKTKALDRSATPVPMAGEGSLVVPAPSGTRLQNYSTYLELRVKTPAKVSDATKRALAITKSLGGYASSVSVDGRGRTADAELRLRIPRTHVQEAVDRLARLGTITAMNVSVADAQAGVNATDARIARLQKQLRELRAQPQSDETKRSMAVLTAQVERLQRSRAQAVRTAHYATVELHMTTRKPAAAQPKPEDGNGPLHGLGVAFRWIGIGAVYALALGAPLLALVALAWFAARALRRRRVDALLSRS
jgi:Domain of unknown function (DUF4349)